MDRKLDLRTIRTQKHMRQALFELVAEKKTKDITVKELSERAEISRSTFYLYYDSIQSMIMSITDESREAYRANAERILALGLDFKGSCIELIRHPFSTEEELLTFTGLIRSGLITWAMAFEAIYSVRDTFLRTFTTQMDPWALDYTFHFIASGIAQTVMKWVEDSDGVHGYPEIAELIIAMLYENGDRFSAIRRI